MEDHELHDTFIKSVKAISNTNNLLPDDVKLKFYAYYKHAVEDIGTYRTTDQLQLRNAFKMNALFQVRRLTKNEAKKKYIALAKKYLK